MIDLTQSELAILLLRSIISGATLGYVYDLIRFCKMLSGVEYGERDIGQKKSGAVLRFLLTFILDLIFWTGAGVVAILLAYSSGGFFRGMILLGMAGGFLTYYFTLGRAILALNKKIAFALKKTLIRLKPKLLKPIKIVFTMIISLYHLTIGRIIDKIIEDRKNKDHKENSTGDDPLSQDSECGKEDFVYVDGKAGYRRDGRVSFGQRVK